MINGVATPVDRVVSGSGHGQARDVKASFESWLANSKAGTRPSMGEEPAMQSSTGDLPLADAQVQLRTAGGRAELIAPSWGLAAKLYLAQETRFSGNIAEPLLPDGSEAGSKGNGAQHLKIPESSSVQLSSDVSASSAVLRQGPAAASLSLSVVTSTFGGKPLELASSGGALAATLPWAQRLMRLLEGPGLESTLWIRDYELDETAARAMADAMQALARDQGLCLDRIVVNGRSLWHSPANQIRK